VLALAYALATPMPTAGLMTSRTMGLVAPGGYASAVTQWPVYRDYQNLVKTNLVKTMNYDLGRAAKGSPWHGADTGGCVSVLAF